MMPLRDRNPTARTPWVTLAIIAVCVGVYFLVQPEGRLIANSATQRSESDATFTIRNAAIPCEVTRGRPLTVDELNRTYVQNDANACERHPTSPAYDPAKNVYLAILVSMFLHGSLLHIGGNMLYLWIFGNNIEDRFGRLPYLAFYLVGGGVAAAAHILIAPNSTVPVVGASGAIAAVMGAYLVMFPRVRISTLFFFIVIFFRDVQARWLLLFWFVSQFFVNQNSGVAWVAHVGGFVFGVLGGLVYRSLRPQRTATAAVWG